MLWLRFCVNAASIFVQKEYKRALDIWLSIADPCVFDHINHHPELYDAAGRGAAQLMVVDADRAIDMLVEHHDKVVANDVIVQLRARIDTCPQDEIAEWRQRLCRYMHTLFLKDRRAPHNYHDLQVCSTSAVPWPALQRMHRIEAHSLLL